MKVLKFGGSSVGSKEGRSAINEIVCSFNEQTIVIVSALGGVTDTLIAMAKEAAASNESAYLELFEQVQIRHREAIRLSVLPNLQAEVGVRCDALLQELSNILKGVYLISDLSPKTEAAIVAYGERLNSIIIASTIDGALCVDAREIIKTQPYFGRHIVDFTITNALIREQIGALSARVIVLGGFISSDKLSNETTNLGRGGSDYSASIIAAALHAKQLYIYTDVDGFLSADPRIIDGAILIDRLSFVEAMELCNFGAKVIYAPTIFPAYNANIPIIIRNTFNPNSQGTYISKETHSDFASEAVEGGDTAGNSEAVGSDTVGNSDTVGCEAVGNSETVRGKTIGSEKIIKGISSINDTALLTVRGLGSVGVIGVNYRIFKALSKAGISLFLVSQTSSENSTSIAMKNSDVNHAVEVLHVEFAQEIVMGEIDECVVQKNLATIGVVGQRMKETPGIAGQLYGTLGREGVNVIAAAQGASQTNISFITELSSLRKAINVLHNSFFLSEFRELNLYIVGIGTVGRNLLEQISTQQKLLMERNGLKINVVAISNSTATLFSATGLTLTHYRELLATNAATKSTASDIFGRIIGENLPNSVFVDCTASPDIAALYDDLLAHNISVVTANKIAASSDYEHYCSLKATARERGIKFLFETNVGAGLPIINTINALRSSGDTILGLQAVISGTLNSIFNDISSDTTLSEALRSACEAGYAEPDARIDLSGIDAARKLVILARESGYRVNIEDVERELLIDDSLFSGSLDDFWAKLPSGDARWEERRQKLAAQGKRWRFVAQMEVVNGEPRCKVSLQELGAEHPFYNLERSNNTILIKSARYHEYPLQIKGYGAGASVSAAGVFADIMSIANIR